ncbi:MAG TPA: sodium:proton antiporter NhaD [Pseudomonadales bacterium]|nr:sodium:proton antiporter NhaD [Pseudomonadales bacterium]
MAAPLLLITLVFCFGYLAIALENSLRIDKAALALLTGVLCWIIAAPLSGVAALEHSLGEIAAILFFLLGAMTIVELVDSYDGFAIITRHIRAGSQAGLLWITGFFTFFLSAVLDNLTASILMVSLLRKLVPDKSGRLFFAGIVVIAANAGGAWSPIGDVTTTMLWIGGQVTALAIIKTVLLPSLVCLAVPLAWLSWRLHGLPVTLASTCDLESDNDARITETQRRIVLLVGMGGLLFVPVFKTLTHLPPFMGMLLSLSILWIVSELIQPDRDQAVDSGLHIVTVLKRIDTPSILFFLGILLAVSALEATGLLHLAAQQLDALVGNTHTIIFLVGLLSAVVDNVPLVAAAIGMYDIQTFPVDHSLWTFLAYSAGTGGSCLIIGSAAGVAVMGMERISFLWYLRHISALALAGYGAGAVVYLLIYGMRG